MPRPCCCCRRRATATAWVTAEPSSIGASSQIDTPSPKRPCSCSAASKARLVLPTPPTPVSVTSGPSCSAAVTRCDVLLTSDEAGDSSRQSRKGSRDRHRRRGLNNRVSRIAVEDLLVHDAQRRARIDAELVDEPFAHLSIGVESVGLPAAAVLGQHQLPCQALVEGVGLQSRSELAEQVGVPSGAQRGVVAIQRDRKPLHLKGIPDIVEPRRVERRERFTSPQRPAPRRTAPRRPPGPSSRGPGRPCRGIGARRPTAHRPTARSRRARGRSARRRRRRATGAAATDRRPARYVPGAA